MPSDTGRGDPATHNRSTGRKRDERVFMRAGARLPGATGRRCCRSGSGSEAGWHSAALRSQQPWQYVDDRVADHRQLDASEGRLQQSDHVRPAQAAGQPRYDRARSGDQLVVEQGRHRPDLHAATRGQMA